VEIQAAPFLADSRGGTTFLRWRDNPLSWLPRRKVTMTSIVILAALLMLSVSLGEFAGLID